MSYFIDATFIVGAYLVGSISFAVIVCRSLKLPDPRSHGSGNPGATNVMRKSGKWPGVLTLCGDFGKAVIPMLLAGTLGEQGTTVALVGAAAFIGHIFPIYHRFQGGKGVATFLGALTVLSWQATLVWLAVWLATYAAFRYVSLASMTASLAGAAGAWMTIQNQPITLLVSLMALLILTRHHQNIYNLRHCPEQERAG